MTETGSLVLEHPNQFLARISRFQLSPLTPRAERIEQRVDPVD